MEESINYTDEEPRQMRFDLESDIWVPSLARGLMSQWFSLSLKSSYKKKWADNKLENLAAVGIVGFVTASQNSEGWNGDPARAIDGNTDGNYGGK